MWHGTRRADRKFLWDGRGVGLAIRTSAIAFATHAFVPLIRDVMSTVMWHHSLKKQSRYVSVDLISVTSFKQIVTYGNSRLAFGTLQLLGNDRFRSSQCRTLKLWSALTRTDLWRGAVVSHFKFNESGYRELLQQIADNLNAADQKFRSTHTGLPVDVVRADAPDALPAGITLGASDLDAYAAAVAAGELFEFRLKG
jgi:hypothetical protein